MIEARRRPGPALQRACAEGLLRCGAWARRPAARPCVWRGLAWALLLSTPFAQALPAGAGAGADAAPPASRLAFSQLVYGGEVLDVEWQLPPLPAGAQPWAWLLLQHGFMRRCANLRHTAAHLAQAGVATLCVNAPDLSGGAPRLAAVAAAQLFGPQARAPDGHTRPDRVLVGGHSAGALFAAHLGAALHASEPRVLSAALLFDPVGGATLGEALSLVAAQGRRPVLALLAPPSKCNARHLARRALQRVADAAGTAGVAPQAWVWPPGATHVDVEAEDTEAVAVWACGDGWPRPLNVAGLRSVSQTWLQAVQQGLGPAAVADRVRDQLAQPMPAAVRPVPLLATQAVGQAR